MVNEPGRIETLTDVPADQLADIVKSFTLDGAVKVIPEMQANGTFTVHAYFPADVLAAQRAKLRNAS
jgi:hypothetical protein